jgi:riboflavin biosynthesis pyrimidine reductase
VEAPVEVVRLPECTPYAVLADLRARGVRALLSEGGPTLFHGFLEAGLVDELFLTLTPLLTGDEAETSILRGARLADPSRFTLRWVLRAEDELFLRYASVR